MDKMDGKLGACKLCVDGFMVLEFIFQILRWVIKMYDVDNFSVIEQIDSVITNSEAHMILDSIVSVGFGAWWNNSLNSVSLSYIHVCTYTTSSYAVSTPYTLPETQFLNW